MKTGAISLGLLVLSASCSAPAPPSAVGAGEAGSTLGERLSQELALCVIEKGELVLVRGQYDPVSGDTLIGGEPFRAAYPETTPPYASDATWLYTEPLLFRQLHYVAHGPPRILPPDALTPIGEYRGIPLFVEVGMPTAPPGAVYVPLRPGCEFQPFIGFSANKSLTHVSGKDLGPEHQERVDRA